MNNFNDFVNEILSLGGPWNEGCLAFISREKEQDFVAHCTPPRGYPLRISTINRTGAYLRGNYELVYYCHDAGKYTSAYFNTIDELKTFLFQEGIMKQEA